MVSIKTRTFNTKTEKKIEEEGDHKKKKEKSRILLKS